MTRGVKLAEGEPSTQNVGLSSIKNHRRGLTGRQPYGIIKEEAPDGQRTVSELVRFRSAAQAAGRATC